MTVKIPKRDAQRLVAMKQKFDSQPRPPSGKISLTESQFQLLKRTVEAVLASGQPLPPEAEAAARRMGLIQ